MRRMCKVRVNTCISIVKCGHFDGTEKHIKFTTSRTRAIMKHEHAKIVGLLGHAIRLTAAASFQSLKLAVRADDCENFRRLAADYVTVLTPRL